MNCNCGICGSAKQKQKLEDKSIDLKKSISLKEKIQKEIELVDEGISSGKNILQEMTREFALREKDVYNLTKFKRKLEQMLRGE